MTLDYSDLVIQHTDSSNARAHRLFAGMFFARCTDLDHLACPWQTRTPGRIRTGAVEHCMRQGHVVAVIDNGVVTTLVPVQRDGQG